MNSGSRELVERLLATGSPLDDGSTKVFVPEHVVKELLREHSVRTPACALLDVAESPSTLGLVEPLVLKAWGPGLLHKSDVGAVQLNVAEADLTNARDTMGAQLDSFGITPAGYLVEEQAPGVVELIVGIVRDPSFGPMVLLGLGGVATELLGLSAMAPCPLTPEAAEALVAEFPGAGLLTGARGGEPLDRDGVVQLLLAIAGADGVVARLGEQCVELECNPVAVSAERVVALDARLILDPTPGDEARQDAVPTDFASLFAPRNIAVAGASTSKSTFGNRFLAAYREIGWTDGLYALHPTASSVDGVPAVASVEEIPGGLDYLVVAVPAKAAVDLVAAAAGYVRFGHVVSGGFGEVGPDGAALESSLVDAVAGTSTRLVGPNCLGVFSPAGRQAFTLGAPKERGTVAVVSQSGGLSGDVVTVGSRRGLRYSKVISIGNSVDVTHADLVEWLADDPETAAIGLYLEGCRDGRRLAAALGRAGRTKPVVLMRGGASSQGARAAQSHTGSMATDEKVWGAIARATGITTVATLEDFLGTLNYLRVARPADPKQTGVLVIGLGGGASVLAADACDRAGLTLTPVREDVRRSLRSLGHGAGTSLANPIEIPIGPASPPESLSDALAPILAEAGQAFADVIVHLNVAAYYNYGTAGLKPLVDTLAEVVSRKFEARFAFVTRNILVAEPADRQMLTDFAQTHDLQLFESFDQAAVAVASAQRFDEHRIRE